MPRASDRVVITGMNGFTGPHLARELVARGATVFGMARSAPAERPVALGAVELIRVDLFDRDAVFAHFERIQPDAVFHLATSRVGSATALVRDNVTLADNVLAATARLGNRRRRKVLVVGSAAEYGAASGGGLLEDAPLAPLTPYGLSKMVEVALTRSYWFTAGLETYVARAFNLVGPGEPASLVCGAVASQIAAVEQGAREPVVVVGDLAARRDFVDVRDAVRAYARIVDAGRPGEIYNVCSGIETPIESVVRALVRRAEVPIHIAVDDARRRVANVPVCSGNPERMRRLGWEPRLALERSLQDVLADWRARYRAGAGAPLEASLTAHADPRAGVRGWSTAGKAS